MQQVVKGKWNGKWNWKWRFEWEEVVIAVLVTLMISMFVTLVWLFFAGAQETKKEEQAHALLVEQTSFEVSGTVELLRQSKIVEEPTMGFFGEIERITTKSYVMINGVEYLLNEHLNVDLEQGQEIVIKGYDGQVNEIVIEKR